MYKKILLFILLFIGLFTLTACSNKRTYKCSKDDNDPDFKIERITKVELKGKKITKYYIIAKEKFDDKKSFEKACTNLADYYKKERAEGKKKYKSKVECSKLRKQVLITKTYDVSKYKSIEQIDNLGIQKYTNDDFTFDKKGWIKEHKENDYKC